MERALLNVNQRRRVATHLRLLAEDLAEVSSWPELSRPGEPYAGIREVVSALQRAIQTLRGALDLPSDGAPPLRRRVMATAEVWATSMEDVTARRLRAYGKVHPELGGVLDPRTGEIVRLLRRLAALADRLPEA
jgi:hypothetical protein